MTACNLQVSGKVSCGENVVTPIPPGPLAPVDVCFYLNTHFEMDCKISLQKENYEEDAVEACKGRIASAATEYQLQRAIFSAATCLTAGTEECEEKGNQILDAIDSLERYTSNRIVPRM